MASSPTFERQETCSFLVFIYLLVCCWRRLKEKDGLGQRRYYWCRKDFHLNKGDNYWKRNKRRVGVYVRCEVGGIHFNYSFLSQRAFQHSQVLVQVSDAL